MNEKNLRKLEFDKIIELLAGCCASSLGRELAGALKPSTRLETIRVWQEQTSEAKNILRSNSQVPLAGIKDIGGHLQKVKIGGVLSSIALIETGQTLDAAHKLKKFSENLNPEFKHLKELGVGLTRIPQLEEDISRCLLPEGEVADTASEELGRIRAGRRSKQNQLKEKLDQIIKSPTWQKYLQEPIVTIRRQRFVVPVKIEYRAQVPGILHDQSASGATLFIEPMVVVELSNEVRRLEVREEQEIQRILTVLSGLVGESLAELEQNLDILAEIDFVFAKGKLSLQMNGGAPELNGRGLIRIIHGRHPLIKGEVVPVDIELGERYNILVITGPNTGGKTVTLKTTGLFVLMAQGGLHLPCEYGSTVGVFDQIYVDIGDEQSIEQSLSTFSSHMMNIINIVNNLTPKSLVLLDELGAGTDPTEGAALAMAILDYFLQKRVKTVATTHYSGLKAFAYANNEVENASVEFDTVTLRPTYRLLTGVPGRSNAFEISQRLGLQRDIIEKARDYLTREEIKVADLIKNLEENQLVSEIEREQARSLKQEALVQLESMKDKEASLKQRETVILQAAHEEAARILGEAKLAANGLLKEIREIRNTAASDREKIAMQARERLTKLRQGNLEQFYALGQENVEEAQPQVVKPGDQVFLSKFKQKGEVLTEPTAGGEIQVQAGILKITVKLNEVRLIKEERIVNEKTIQSSMARQKAKNIRTEINVRGYLADDALYELEKYLDDALLAGLPAIKIIHGKGTGALREAIRDFLTSSPYVKKFRLGSLEEGGAGVTLVEI